MLTRKANDVVVRDQLVVTHSMPREQQHKSISGCSPTRDFLDMLTLWRCVEVKDISAALSQVLPESNTVVGEMSGIVREVAFSKLLQRDNLPKIRGHTFTPLVLGVGVEQVRFEFPAQLICFIGCGKHRSLALQQTVLLTAAIPDD